MPGGHPWGNSWGHPLGGHVLRISLGGRLISGSESSLESSASTAAATCGACVNHMLLQSGGQFMTNYLNRAHQRMPNLGLRKGGGLQGHLLSNRWGEQFMTNYLNRAHQRMPNLGLRKGGSLQGQLLGNLGKSLGLNHTLLQCGGKQFMPYYLNPLRAQHRRLQIGLTPRLSIWLTGGTLGLRKGGSLLDLSRGLRGLSRVFGQSLGLNHTLLQSAGGDNS